jgi:hypothetical protein
MWSLKKGEAKVMNIGGCLSIVIEKRMGKLYYPPTPPQGFEKGRGNKIPTKTGNDPKI